MSIRIDPSTGLKVFDTRAAKATDKIAGKGYSVIADEALTTLPTARRRARCSTPRSRRSTASTRRPAVARPTTWRWRASSAATSRTCTPLIPSSARRSPTSARSSWSGAGFAGLLLWYKLREAGLRRRALLREGRRRRRHLVLEPLPGHRLRRRVLQLPPAARGDGLRPDDEVRVGLRDPRVLPEDGGQVRLLRSLPVPHHRREDRVGRGRRPLDGLHRPRRRHAGPLRDPRQRHPDHAQAGPHRGHGDVQGRRVPHLALELQRRPRRQAGRHHRHRRHRRAGRSPSWPRSWASSTSSSARPSTIDMRDQRATSPEEIEDVVQGAGLGQGPARARSPGSRRAAPPSRPTTTTSPARWPTSRSASSTSAGCRPRS